MHINLIVRDKNIFSTLKMLADFIYIWLLTDAQLDCAIKVVSKKETNHTPSNGFFNARNFVLSSASKRHSVNSLVPLKAVTETETQAACFGKIEH